MIRIVNTEQIHIDELKETARQSDIIEAQYQTGLDFKEALQQTFDCSKYSYTGLTIDHKVIGVFGVATDLANPFTNGVVYLITSNEINRLECSKALISNGHKFIEGMLNEYKVLHNITLSDNAESIMWLKRLGFVFGEDFIFNDKLFKYFEIRR